MSTTETLYPRLPAVIRTRDAERGEPLRALLLALDAEFGRMDEALATLYDNLFIETCEEWAAPYIGDLVRAPQVRGLADQGISARSVIGNTVAYRRRKGTLGVLEALVDDVADWAGHGAEFRRQLAWVQHLAHPLPDQGGTQDLRFAEPLDRLGGPFEVSSRTAEVRTVRQRGRYGLGRMGVFAWPEEPALLENVDAYADPSASGRFHFDPRGRVQPLYNLAAAEATIAHISAETEVPGQIRRRALHADLLADEGDRHYLGANPSFRLTLPDDSEIAPDDMVVANLRGWWRPPAGKVAVDPELGRVCFPLGTPPSTLRVTYRRGGVLQIGAGPWDRSDSVDAAWASATWQAGVSKDAALVGVDNMFGSLEAAISAWNTDHEAGTVGIVCILDSRTYSAPEGGFPIVQLKAGARLLVIAAGWPSADGTPSGTRTPGEVEATELQPQVRGDLRVEGLMGGGGEFHVNGIDLVGRVRVLPGALGAVSVTRCTLLHGVVTKAGLEIGGDGTDGWNTGIEATITQSIVEGVAVGAKESALTLARSAIVPIPVTPDDPAPPVVPEGVGVTAVVADATISGSTVFGSTLVRSLTATDAVFGTVVVERKQGCSIDHSYVSPGSSTPKRVHCLPDAHVHDLTDDTERARAQVRARPVFTSVSPVHPAFGLLSPVCHAGLRTGASDGGEMGVTNQLGLQVRWRNIHRALDEFAPLGADILITLVSGEYTP